ncbi:hypothetical protein [Roseibium sp.]|uniref:hypothetical protein n=1 Tax=Roseibium sp. TaxID=1936156 RepID=UPI003BA9EE34
MSKQPSAFSPLVKMLVDAGFVTLYIGSLVFISGWSYADRYFAELGLNISAIDGLDAASFSVYALWILRDAVLTFVVVLAGVFLAFSLFRTKVGPIHDTWMGALIALIATISLFGAAHLGADRAKSQVKNLFTEDTHNTVRVRILANKNSTLAEYLSKRPGLSESGCLRKIYMDKRHLYAYAGYESERGPQQNILVIPLSEIALIETLAIRDLCEL